MGSAIWPYIRPHARWAFLRYQAWRQLLLAGEWELKILRDYVRPSATAIDVGGNIGMYSYHLHRLAKQVFTFEPNPEYVSVLRDLRMGNCRIEQVALSSEAGSVELRIPRVDGEREDRGMASIEPGVVGDDRVSRRITVPMRRLDDYDFKDVGFIKIDVEGHEEGVLAGALGTLETSRPTLLIEIEERHNVGGLRRIQTLLAERGYDGFFFLKGQKTPLDDFDPAILQQPPESRDAIVNHRRSATYINNFLFVPRT